MPVCVGGLASYSGRLLLILTVSTVHRGRHCVDDTELSVTDLYDITVSLVLLVPQKVVILIE